MVQGSKWTLSSLWKYLLENFGIQKTPIWDEGDSWWNFQLFLTSPDYHHITRWLWCREFNSYGAPSLFLSQWKISLSRVFCLQKQHCKKSTNRWASITLCKKLAMLGRCDSLIHLILKNSWKIITIFGLRALGHARVGLVNTWKF